MMSVERGAIRCQLSAGRRPHRVEPQAPRGGDTSPARAARLRPGLSPVLTLARGLRRPGDAPAPVLGRWLRPPPIDAPCTQCLRHGGPIHARKGLTAAGRPVAARASREGRTAPVGRGARGGGGNHAATPATRRLVALANDRSGCLVLPEKAAIEALWVPNGLGAERSGGQLLANGSRAYLGP
jgi:hypothetical protein